MRTDQERQEAPITRREVAAVFVFWTFIALLESANRLLEPGERGLRAGVPAGVQVEFFEAYVWALVTPLVFWLCTRVGLRRTHWLQPALILLGVGLAIGVVVDIAENLFEAVVLGYTGRNPGMSPVQSLMRLWFLNDFMVYVGILAAGLGRVWFFRARARQGEAVRLQAHAARLEAQLAEARLEALRMQINPHFLFNALHAVSTLVDRDPDGVRRMIALLANLLRATLRTRSEPMVTLERELEFLEQYLEIMRIRFQGRLDVDYDVDPRLLDALVPNLILQPLVENAIKHGVGESTEPAHVTLRATSSGERLELIVLDDGPGPDAGSIDHGGGIGLRNVRQRLEEHYGPDAELRLESGDEGGARALVQLPLRYADAPAADPVHA